MGEKFKFLLKQGIGQATKPVVQVSDRVTRGQLIGDIDKEKLGVPLHSSVTGLVKEVTEDYILVEKTSDEEDFVALESEDSLERVREAGIIGMGGAGFPAYVKLKTDLSESGYVICNAAECEPILEHNIYQIRENPDKLIKAIRLVMDITGAEKGIIGIKLKNKEAIKALTSRLKPEDNIRVHPLRNRYPVGEERALIKNTLNVLLEPGDLPAKANALVLNVETLMNIYDAIELKKPSIDKYITVAGNFKALSSGDYAVRKYPQGKFMENIIEEFEGARGDIGEILVGGPYTGHRYGDGEVVTKISGGIIATDPFDKIEGKLGIIQCACGPNKERIKEIAESLGGELVGHLVCKNAEEAGNGNYKCKDPGNCPGQAEKVLELRRNGAEHILIGHCSDCSNTVMQAAPKLNIEVHHATDQALRSMNMEVIRYLKD